MSVTINNFSNNLMERKRVIKTTRIQYEIYVKFLEENKPFALGKTDLIANENYFAEKWNELTALLNTSGTGPTRTQQSWKTVIKIIKYFGITRIVLNFLINWETYSKMLIGN